MEKNTKTKNISKTQAEAKTISFFMGVIILLIICMGSIIVLQRVVINIQAIKMARFQETTIRNYQSLEQRVNGLQNLIMFLIEDQSL